MRWPSAVGMVPMHYASTPCEPAILALQGGGGCVESRVMALKTSLLIPVRLRRPAHSLAGHLPVDGYHGAGVVGVVDLAGAQRPCAYGLHRLSVYGLAHLGLVQPDVRGPAGKGGRAMQGAVESLRGLGAEWARQAASIQAASGWCTLAAARTVCSCPGGSRWYTAHASTATITSTRGLTCCPCMAGPCPACAPSS